MTGNHPPGKILHFRVSAYELWRLFLVQCRLMCSVDRLASSDQHVCMQQEAGIYLRNELRAHAAVYKAIKALPGESICLA